MQDVIEGVVLKQPKCYKIIREILFDSWAQSYFLKRDKTD